MTMKVFEFIVLIIIVCCVGGYAKNCKDLADNYLKEGSPKRVVAQCGEVQNLTVYWSSDIGWAPAALLVAVLRHGLGYQNVYLKQKHKDVCGLVRSHPWRKTLDYSEWVIDLSVPWDVSTKCLGTDGNNPLMTGKRFAAVGPGVIPAASRLHLHFAENVLNDTNCLKFIQLSLYSDERLYSQCLFSDYVPYITGILISRKPRICDSRKCFPIFVPKSGPFIGNLSQIINIKSFPLFLVILNGSFRSVLSSADFENRSFLFVDYDIWHDRDNVVPIVLPRVNNQALSDVDTTRSLKIANLEFLKQYAPNILEIIRQFTLSSKDLREILITNNVSHEDAACKWAHNNDKKFKSFLLAPNNEFDILLVLCNNDPDISEYIKLGNAIQNATNQDIKYFLFKIKIESINCSDVNGLRSVMEYERKDFSYIRLAGIIAGGEGTAAAANYSSGIETELILYDVISTNVQLGPATYSVTGNIHKLVLAYRQLFTNYNWERYAILSDDSSLSKSFRDLFTKSNDIYRNYDLKKDNVEDYLKQLLSFHVRIFVVNANAELAASILCTAQELGMTLQSGYVWILRDWSNVPLTCHLEQFKHFTVSYSWRGGSFHEENRSLASEKMRNLINGIWPEGTWPQYAAPIADAIVFLMHGFSSLLNENPQWLSDPHGQNCTEIFTNSIKNLSINGVSNKLKFRAYTIDDPFLFFEEWRGFSHDLLSVWKFKKNEVIIKRVYRSPFDDAVPEDYRNSCKIKLKDDFAPTCFDTMLIIIVVFIGLTPFALYVVRMVRKDLVARRELRLKECLLDKQDKSAGQLAPHLIDHKYLKEKENLGAGYFGEVKLCILRLPSELPQEVAAKILNKFASRNDERNFVREVRLIRNLKHDHIVKFIGISFLNAQFYLLMEYAFHGDLKSYLRDIKVLSRLGKDEELHITAEDLTRLAREAASALSYLEECRIVHRDVRACNCLLDTDLALKLADFGMAIKIDEDYDMNTYSVISVMSVAPETLADNIITFKSDIWSLGILMVELVTLGKNPYGNLKLYQVVEHIKKGGQPFLPFISVEFRALVLSCWKRNPEERPSALEVENLLVDNPTILDPWCPSAPSTPTVQSDNGFYEI